MGMSLLLTKKIAAMFLMMLCGYGLVRLKIVKSEDSRILSLLMVNALVPCMIIDSFQIECTPDRLHDFLALMGASALAQFSFMLFSALLKKPLKLRRVEQAALTYPNCGNLILPLVASVFGEDMVFFACPYVCVQTIVIWIHGRILICGGQDKLDWKKVFLNINVVCTLIGLILFLTGLRLPNVISDACDSLGGMVGPTSMLLTGMLIGGADLKKVFSQARCYGMAALRLLVYPMLFVLILKISRYSALTSSPAMLVISVLGASAPSATTVTNMAQVYRSDPEIAAAINIITMIFCIASMPLVNLFCQIMIP